MEIEIKNLDLAENTCNQINSYNNQLIEVCTELEILLKRLENVWESNTTDRDTYTSELRNQIININSLTDTISIMVRIIVSYMDNIKTISSKSVK